MPTQTAAQKRAQAKAEYDAFLANCPSRQLLDRVSDKWVALLLAALGSDGELALIKSVIRLIKPPYGFDLDVSADFPVGSGLGGSAVVSSVSSAPSVSVGSVIAMSSQTGAVHFDSPSPAVRQ